MNRYKTAITAIAMLAMMLPHYANAQKPDPDEKTISPFTDPDVRKTERQRHMISELIDQHLGYTKPLTKVEDLEYLQRVIDKGLVDQQNRYQLQALGVMLGDIMENNMPLRWVILKDRYGRSRALQFEDSEHLFFPVTMISRRVDQDKEIDIPDLYGNIKIQVKGLIYKKSKYRQLPRHLR